jgi:tetratricopeptide (TPR) repeat protein
MKTQSIRARFIRTFLCGLVLLGAAILPAGMAAQDALAPPSGTPAAGYSQPDAAKRAEAYYNYTMGHLNEVYYLNSSRSEFANAAIDFYKKAYELDPSSALIAERLAEMYYQAQRTRDAVVEAQAIIQKDPNNLPARRLLVRIYLRTLGDLSAASAQKETATRAIEQLEEIRRIEPGDKDSAVWLARLYRVRGDNQKAEDVLRGILAGDPADPAAVEQLAQLLLDQGRGQDAIKLLEDATKTDPKAGLLDLLGDAYSQLHQAAKAEEVYRQAITLEPDEPSHHRGLAQVLMSEEKFPQALDEYKRLAALDPDDPDNYLRIAEIDRQMHKLDDAEQAIAQAKERAPGNLEVTYSEAMIYEAQGRYDDAIRVLSGAITSVKSGADPAPSNRRTLAILFEQLGRVYREAGNNTAALNTFNDLAALGDEEAQRASVLIIDTYRADRDLAHALEAADKAVAKYPQDRDLRITRALLLGDKGEADPAAAQLRELLTHTPQDIEIYLDLSQIYQQSHRFPDAESALAQANQLATRGSDKEMVEFMLGGVFEQEKKYDQAEDEFKQVLTLNPRNAPALNYYGYMLADRGQRLPEATDLVKRALAEDPQNGAYLDSLGWAYYKQGRLPEAEEALRKAVDHERNDPTILDHLGDVYFKRGKIDLAVAQWQRALEEWHHVLPTENNPDKVAALEEKLSSARHRVAEEKKTNGPGALR